MSNRNRWTNCAFYNPGRFFLRVLTAFRKNQGFLLSGAVAYHVLLSIVPLMALLLVGLSHFIEEAALLATVRNNLSLIMPAEADVMTAQVKAFLDNRGLVGWLGMLVLIFFSTMAFSVLERAMSVVFYHRVAIHHRHFLVSVMIPFLFILLLGLGIMLVTFISGALQSLDQQYIELFGFRVLLTGSSGVLLYALGFLGLVLLLSSLYLVMPVGTIAWRHALIGGLVAGVLWEITRHLLVWYFSTLSLVNLVYGSFATAIVALLSFEAASLILLFGAQVIAEFERCSVEGDFET
ncbi:MAG: YihY/virulence factor BrkB family protein [Candidatus Sedimenticola sp. 20ELBAFRAG]